MIEVRGLTKRYGPTVAVDGLTFEVKPGTVTGFLGPNGSGKSTTMRMIIGLDEPDAGQAWIGGRSYRELGWPLRRVGSLLEAKSFHPGSRPVPIWPRWPPATACPTAGWTRCWTSSA
jgi:ABC-2 type transport system ATP-binding protein